MENIKPLLFLLGFGWILFFACHSPQAEKKKTKESATAQKPSKPLFSLLSHETTGIDFINTLHETVEVNTYNYINSYSGGGVAIGDINNDGLTDIFLTGNTVPDKLFLNKGNMTFEDITATAGVAGGDGWSSGVTMGDVNGDGLLDIYVCKAFNDRNPLLRANLLYINNGDGTFTESAKAYKVDNDNLSTQATFFDYDLDGDLDLFVGNHPRVYNLNSTYSFQQVSNPKLENSDRLYRNNGNGSFSDVTRSSGILNYGFLLGVIAGDLNDDGWPDLYLANDHQEPDILFINNKNGTFTDGIHDYFKHISYFSMGIDMADYNNDGLLDIIVADMMAEDNYRQKTQMASMDPQGFWNMVDHGYHYQYMRNALQLNNGNGTFSEIALLAGVSYTDWSWATLFADFDNDGLKDLFVTNGYKRDIKDKDFVKKIDDQLASSGGRYKKDEIFQILSMIPTTLLSNKYYRNKGDLTFADLSASSGLNHPGISTGAAYGDLDNDGDLDLVVSNINDEVYIHQNNTNEIDPKRYVRVQLKGQGKNPYALGAKVTLKYRDQLQYQELTLTRGFQSSVDHVLHFGLGDQPSVDEILVEWPDGKTTTMTDVPSDQLVVIDQQQAQNRNMAATGTEKKYFTDITAASGAKFTHRENEFDDYEKEVLLPHRMSHFGPHIAVGDVNGDQRDDFYVGGAAGQAGKLFIQQSSGKFVPASGQPWTHDRKQEDIQALFFDADQDKDLDLYVVSGGSEFPAASPLLQDRLYVNDGKGRFIKTHDALPEMLSSGSCVSGADFDADGDTDLFVGGRVVPGRYPLAPRSYILENMGGRFRNSTADLAPDLEAPGLVTDAVWTDFNGDGDTDLMVVGEWMPIGFYQNNNGKFENITATYGLENSTGWWTRIIAADMDRDGDTDYIAGNLGLNYKYTASEQEPLHVYCHDFDNSGSLDIVLGYYNRGICYPVRGRQCSSEQMPMIKKKFPTYDQFATATLKDIYGSTLDEALHLEARYFASAYIENQGYQNFVLKALPVEAQFSMVQDMIPGDFNHDNHPDLLIAGNFWVAEVETGRADASIGLLLTGDGKGNFESVHVNKSGFFAPGDVRDMAVLNKGQIILVTNNDGPLQVFRHQKSRQIAQLSMK